MESFFFFKHKSSSILRDEGGMRLKLDYSINSFLLLEFQNLVATSEATHCWLWKKQNKTDNIDLRCIYRVDNNGYGIQV